MVLSVIREPGIQAAIDRFLNPEINLRKPPEVIIFDPPNIIVNQARGMYLWYVGSKHLRPNSPGPHMDNWKVTDNSCVNFHDVFFFIFCYNLAKNEE